MKVIARSHCKESLQESWHKVIARSSGKELWQGVIARSQLQKSLQGVIARSHCKESWQGVIARVIARSDCKESLQGIIVTLQGVMRVCETFDPERLANHISSLSNCTLTKRQRLYESCHENAQILLITQRELQAHRDVRYMHRLAPRLRLI